MIEAQGVWRPSHLCPVISSYLHKGTAANSAAHFLCFSHAGMVGLIPSRLFTSELWWSLCVRLLCYTSTSVSIACVVQALSPLTVCLAPDQVYSLARYCCSAVSVRKGTPPADAAHSVRASLQLFLPTVL